MNKNVQTLAPDDRLMDASDLFLWRGFRHLPIVAPGGRMVGLLSQRDLLVFQARCGDASWKSLPIAQAMRAPFETAGPDDSLTEATARMRDHKIGCLPITQNGVLIGLVTVTDILGAHVTNAMQTDPPEAVEQTHYQRQ